MTFLFNTINTIISLILTYLDIAQEIKDAKDVGWELQLSIKKGIITGLMHGMRTGIAEYSRAYRAECARTSVEWHNTPRMRKHWAQLCDLDKQASNLVDRIAALNDQPMYVPQG